MTELSTITSRLTTGQVQTLLGMGLAQRQVFGHELLSTLEPDEQARAIQDLRDDLGTPLKKLSRGPLSFHRLTGLPVAETEAFHHRSILEILASNSTNRRVIESFVEYGRLLSDDRWPVSTQMTGFAITALASSALARLHHVSYSRDEIADFVSILDSVVKSDAAPAALRSQVQAARNALSDE